MNGDTQVDASAVAHPRNWSQWVVVGVVLLTFALVVPGLGHKGLWIDEADSVYFAQHTWPSLLWGLCDPHPPGYYALLKIFVTLGGASEFVVRFPSALAATLAVAALARLVRELTHGTGEPATTALYRRGARGRRSATADLWLPAALLATAPLHVWYAQEARMYALVALLGLGAAILAVRLARRWRWGDALGYAAVAALALLTDQSALPILLGVNVLWILYTIGTGSRFLRASKTFQANRLVPRNRTSALALWLLLQVAAGAAFWLWSRRADTFAQVSAGTLYPLTMARLSLEQVLAAARDHLPLVIAALGIAALVLVAAIIVALRQMRHAGPGAVPGRNPSLVRHSIVVWGILILFTLGTVASVRAQTLHSETARSGIVALRAAGCGVGNRASTPQAPGVGTRPRPVARRQASSTRGGCRRRRGARSWRLSTRASGPVTSCGSTAWQCRSSTTTIIAPAPSIPGRSATWTPSAPRCRARAGCG